MRRLIDFFMFDLVAWIKARSYGVISVHEEKLGNFSIKVYKVKRDVFFISGRHVFVGPSFQQFWEGKLKVVAFVTACILTKAPIRAWLCKECQRRAIKLLSNMYQKSTDPPFVDGSWVNICLREVSKRGAAS